MAPSRAGSLLQEIVVGHMTFGHRISNVGVSLLAKALHGYKVCYIDCLSLKNLFMAERVEALFEEDHKSSLNKLKVPLGCVR
ncbi:hypothetical protein PS624_02301 [Pseudomonas fluorescens]|uniref:Uncharacterized protein n=1 Tax=Pseudomonas fluorescens TaxID=294 RepID=A0A5E6SIH5_PSEFL|nr:hypothetical protein PS624_02301 [Pseudomonas fluorescens]